MSLNLSPDVHKAASQDKGRRPFTRVPSTPDLSSSIDGGVGVLVGMFDGRSNSSPSHSKPPHLPQTKITAMGSKTQPVGSKAKPAPPLKPSACRDDTWISPGSGNSVAKGNERDSATSQLGFEKGNTRSSGAVVDSISASLLSRQGTVGSTKMIGASANNSTVSSVNSASHAANTTPSAANRMGSTGNGSAPITSKQKVPLKPPTTKMVGGGASEEKIRVPGVGNNRDSPEPSEGRRESSSDSSTRVPQAVSKAQQSVATSDIASGRQAAEDRSRLLPVMSTKKATMSVNGGGGGGNTKVPSGTSDAISKPKLLPVMASTKQLQSVTKQGVVDSAAAGDQVLMQGSGYEPPFMKFSAPPTPTSLASNTYTNITYKPAHSYINVAVSASSCALVGGKAVGSSVEIPPPPLGRAKAKESDDSDEESAWSGDENIADVVYENCGPDEYDRLMTVEELESHIVARGSGGLGTEYLKLRNDRLSGSYRTCRCVCGCGVGVCKWVYVCV